MDGCSSFKTTCIFEGYERLHTINCPKKQELLTPAHAPPTPVLHNKSAALVHLYRTEQMGTNTLMRHGHIWSFSFPANAIGSRKGITYNIHVNACKETHGSSPHHRSY